MLLHSFKIWLRAAISAPIRRPRLYAVDMLLAALSLFLATTFRFGLGTLLSSEEQYVALLVALPCFVVICGIVFPAVGMYSRNWRYASILDMVTIIRAVALASLIFVSFMFLFTRLVAIPRTVIAIEFFVLIFLLAGVRLSFRLEDLKTFTPIHQRADSSLEELVPVLLVGAGNAADIYLRALQRDPNWSYWPVGCLDNNPDHRGLMLRGVPVLGTLNDFPDVLAELEEHGKRPRHLIFTEALGSFGGRSAERLIECAEGLGIAISRLPPATELRDPKTEEGIELRPIELTDLLERPQTALDRAALRRLVCGRRILVTGAGGSIGGELTQQVAALDPKELVLVEHCEYNLYAIDLELAERFGTVPRASYLCNIRDPARVNEIFDRHRPELVFHAAALKHVPMVELNPCEGVLTNVIGTMNIAEAVKRIGALGMVQVSTDKVVNSTNVMGATKRLAELYCQALDLDGIAKPAGPRFLTVRFGNVLGSSGSLIPLFKRQLARGGPLTITDPEMKRFFMTIREAVELTLQASAYGLEQHLGQGEIFVLDMGEPIKIIDIARRMIRLAGFTPDKEIKIEVVGCRPGEKLFEELFDSSEKRVQSPVPGVLGAVSNPVPLAVLQQAFQRLHHAAETADLTQLFQVTGEILPNYRRTPPEAARGLTAVSGPADQRKSVAA
jgi:O-antigen biosynthesis protein WbqV